MAKSKSPKSKSFSRVHASATQVKLTLGELIAAACEEAGQNAIAVARLLTQPQVQSALDKRLVFV